MPQPRFVLLNATDVDAVPAGVLVPRRSGQARQLAHCSWLLRRKRDGVYVASLHLRNGRCWLQPLDADLTRLSAAIDELLNLLGLQRCGPIHDRRPTALASRPSRQQALPPATALLQPLLGMLAELGLDPWLYRAATGLPLLIEPRSLSPAGRDRYGRPLWLIQPAAAAWLRMRTAAADDDVMLQAISGFRSHAYQFGIFRRKRARGLSLAQILTVNAAPGFSEHHSGRALDVGTPGEPPAEASFERTAAFVWLQARAAEFGFRMSYPRDNPHGIVYEPWHWYWIG